MDFPKMGQLPGFLHASAVADVCATAVTTGARKISNLVAMLAEEPLAYRKSLKIASCSLPVVKTYQSQNSLLLNHVCCKTLFDARTLHGKTHNKTIKQCRILESWRTGRVAESGRVSHIRVAAVQQN